MLATASSKRFEAHILQGGMLGVESEIIDATTDEGQRALRDFEEQERAAMQERGAVEAEEVAADQNGPTPDPE
jgi:hypothetical protein